MRVLLDENLPRRLKADLAGHNVSTTQGLGWSGATDAELLQNAGERFDVLVTADRNLEFEQNLAAAKIGIVVLLVGNTRIQTIRPMVPAILAAVD